MTGWKSPAVLVTLLALTATACVPGEREAAMAARRAYYQCLEAHHGDRERCRHLEVEYLQRAAEYEARSQAAWGCGVTPDRCQLLPDPDS